MQAFYDLLYASWVVTGQMAPYLLLGLILSGILSVFISPAWVEKHLGTGKISSIVKATLLGVPLPLCSCGVIPVAASIRRSGASKGATTAFLISTPQTGVDSIFATYGLLGPFFAIFRPLAALITGIIGGIGVSILDSDDLRKTEGDQSINHLHVEEGRFGKIRAALKYGLVTLPGDIAKALIVGIILAGVISTFVSPDFVSKYINNYHLTMFMMLFLGIPIYVCSTSSIPIALGFMHIGITPGAAFVFLISGPATNAAAISVIWKVLGRKSALIYIFTVIIGALLGGYSFDMLQNSFSISQKLTAPCHVELSTPELVSAVLLIAVLSYSLFIKAKREPCSSCSGDVGDSCSNDSFKTVSVKIGGMTCGHCVNAVERAILSTKGVSKAQVSLNDKTATIYGNSFSTGDIITAITTLGYSAYEE